MLWGIKWFGGGGEFFTALRYEPVVELSAAEGGGGMIDDGGGFFIRYLG